MTEPGRGFVKDYFLFQHDFGMGVGRRMINERTNDCTKTINIYN